MIGLLRQLYLNHNSGKFYYKNLTFSLNAKVLISLISMKMKR